ncbi:MAG: hypothetical protein ACREJO_02565 [Phycisphaerales bacterium]
MTALPPPLPQPSPDDQPLRDPQPAASPPAQPLPEGIARLPAFSVAAAFALGWDIFARNWLVLVGAGFVAGLISLVVAFFPHFGWALSLFVAPIGSSLLFMATRAARGGGGGPLEPIKFEWLFTQLRPYWPLFLVNLFCTALWMLLIPFVAVTGLGMGLGAIVTQSGWGVLIGACLLVPVLLAALLAAIYLHIRWYLAPFFVLEDQSGAIGPIDALRRSWSATRGRALSIFAILLCLWLINVAGFLCMFVGYILFSLPLSIAVTGAMYALIAAEARAGESPQPPAATQPPAPTPPPSPTAPDADPPLYGEGLAPSLA